MEEHKALLLINLVNIDTMLLDFQNCELQWPSLLHNLPSLKNFALATENIVNHMGDHMVSVRTI